MNRNEKKNNRKNIYFITETRYILEGTGKRSRCRCALNIRNKFYKQQPQQQQEERKKPYS